MGGFFHTAAKRIPGRGGGPRVVPSSRRGTNASPKAQRPCRPPPERGPQTHFPSGATSTGTLPLPPAPPAHPPTPNILRACARAPPSPKKMLFSLNTHGRVLRFLGRRRPGRTLAGASPSEPEPASWGEGLRGGRFWKRGEDGRQVGGGRGRSSSGLANFSPFFPPSPLGGKKKKERDKHTASESLPVPCEREPQWHKSARRSGGGRPQLAAVLTESGASCGSRRD